MSYIHSPIEIAAGRAVEAALPRYETPSSIDRLANFEYAMDDLTNLSVDTVFSISKSQSAEHSVIVPLGIYATRDALASLVRTDTVNYKVAVKTSDELRILSSFLLHKMSMRTDEGRSFGFAAELGIANMVWEGITECKLGLSYGLLMGTNGYEKDHSGPKGDIDLIVKPYNSGQKKIQIKASSNKANAYYKKGIQVITAQDLVGKQNPEKSIVKLLNWKTASSEEKDVIYERFRKLIGLK